MNSTVVLVGLLGALIAGASTIIDTIIKVRALRTPLDSAGSLIVPHPAATPRSRLRWFARPMLLGLITLLFFGTFMLGRATAPEAQAQPPDGTDPASTNCPGDSQLVEHVRVTVPARHQFGWLELRRSPSCRMAWARIAHLDGEPFTGTPQWVVRLVRPVDGRSEEEHFHVQTTAVYTNMLRDEQACVYAEGQVTIGRDASALIRTSCRQASGK
jgi:Protein of unknown function (DUF2690)